MLTKTGKRKTAKSKRKVDRFNTRTQFADRVNKSRQTLYNWEQAGILPPPDGYGPFGNKLWLDSTIERLLQVESQEA